MTPLDLARRTVALRASLDRALSGLWSRDERQADDALHEHLAASWRSTAAEIRSLGDDQRARAIEICADDLDRAIGTT